MKAKLLELAKDAIIPALIVALVALLREFADKLENNHKTDKTDA